MTAAPNSPLLERVRSALMHSAISLKADETRGDVHLRGMLAPMAQAALEASRAEEMLDTLRWYASDEAYRTEGQPGDTVYDRMRRPERILQDRGQRARALLAKLDAQP